MLKILELNVNLSLLPHRTPQLLICLNPTISQKIKKIIELNKLNEIKIFKMHFTVPDFRYISTLTFKIREIFLTCWFKNKVIFRFSAKKITKINYQKLKNAVIK